MNICQVCGIEHDGNYGSGRFCSNHCRHVYIGKQTKIHINNLPKNKGKGNWKCCWCDFISKTKKELIQHKHIMHKQYSSKGRSAWNKGLTKLTSQKILQSSQKLKQRYKSGQIINVAKGKHWSDEDKLRISNQRKQYLKQHPGKVPYKLNHSSKISYSEQYFIQVINNEKINAKYHLQVGIYQLDFYNQQQKKIFGN